jgi:RNA polymerase sigma factor (sigma-70 family)
MGTSAGPAVSMGWYGGEDLDDATAVAKARDGDLEAYEFLVARHTAAAHRTAVVLGAAADADDVVQEAFVKAFHRLDRYRGESGFRAWLLAIVGNETRNLHRSRRRRDGLVLRAGALEGGEAPVDPQDSALAGDRRRHLIEAVRRLDRRDREVVVCRYLLDLSEAETAAALDLPKGTVKSRTARALGKLRARLDDSGTAGSGREVPGGGRTR